MRTHAMNWRIAHERAFRFPCAPSAPARSPTTKSQLQYLAMPQEMNTFEMPRVPEHADAARPGGRARCSGGSRARWRAGTRRGRAGSAPRSHRPRRRALASSTRCWAKAKSAIRIDGARIVAHPGKRVHRRLARRAQLDARRGVSRRTRSRRRRCPRRSSLRATARRAQRGSGDVDLPPGTMNSPALLAEIARAVATRRAGAPRTSSTLRCCR